MEYTFDTLYRRLCGILGKNNSRGEAQAQAFALLEDMYGASRTDVLMGRGVVFDGKGEAAWAKALEELERGIPMQYVAGRALFLGRYFRVTPDVLIPRPETEQLVKMAVEARPRRVLDCGTGSGCIAVSIALALPESEVVACDVSAAALEVARLNALQQGASVRFLLRSMLEPDAWKDEMPEQPAAEGTDCQPKAGFDLIVSNPPYICASEAKDMEAVVLDSEPHLALFVPDADPLRFYKALSRLGKLLLHTDGGLMLECNTRYAADVALMLEEEGYGKVAVLDDCFGRPRMVKATCKKAAKAFRGAKPGG